MKEKIFDIIETWENEAGEEYFDYNDGLINVINFMFWCNGKGYIDGEKLDKFITRNIKHHEEFCFSIGFTDVLMGEDGFELAFFPDWEATDEEMEAGRISALKIVSEFLAETKYYRNKFKTTIIEHEGFCDSIMEWFPEHEKFLSEIE